MCGFSSRIDSSLHWRSIKSYILYMCGYNLPSLIFILLVIYALIRGYYRKMLEHNIPIYFVAAIVGCGIFMISSVIRASWFSTLFSIIGFVVLLKDVFAVRAKYKNTLTIAMYSIVFLPFRRKLLLFENHIFRVGMKKFDWSQIGLRFITLSIP